MAGGLLYPLLLGCALSAVWYTTMTPWKQLRLGWSNPLAAQHEEQEWFSWGSLGCVFLAGKKGEDKEGLAGVFL